MKAMKTVMVLALGLLSGTALADPLLGSGSMAPTVERTLSTQMRADRRLHPEAWRAVSDLSGLRPAVYTASRLRRPSVSRELRQLGPDALLPMLDVLAVSGYSRTLDATEQDALTVGLLEAVGALRDARALPVLMTAYDRAQGNDQVRAAARGLAMSGDAGALARLQRGAGEGAVERRAITVSALGASPQAEVTPWLLTQLRGGETAVVNAAAEALAERHSSWGAAARRAQDGQRASVASAMVEAYVRASDAGQQRALQVSLLALGAPETVGLLQAAQQRADAATRARLERMARMARR